MKKKSLGLNAFLNGFKSILNLIFPLISFPYISRVLSVSGIGIYNFSNTYVNYFILIAGLGVATYGNCKIVCVRMSDSLNLFL